MAVTLNEIREGSVVMVRGDFGRGVAVVGQVEEALEDIKNGMPGIDYSVKGVSHWAYLDAIDSVVRF